MNKILVAITLVFLSFGLNAQTYKNWESFSRVDEMDDSVRKGAYTKSLNKNSYYQATLFVFCENGEKMKAYITDIGYYPSHKSPFKVDLRADKDNVVNEKWLSLSDSKGVWKGDASDLTAMFKKANSVVIRTNNGISGAKTWKFSASGFTRSISNALKQCE